nr:hypothetical protein [Desulfovulcanus ferrireducens]
MSAIPFRDLRQFNRPYNPKAWVVDMEATLSLRVERFGVKVNHFAILCKRLEAMGKPFGDKKVFSIIQGKNFAVPAQKGRGTLPDIHRDIEDLAPEATHNLGFNMWRVLKMQTANSALPEGMAVVDLGNTLVKSDLLRFLCAKKTAEETPLVLDGHKFHNIEAFKKCRVEMKTVIFPCHALRSHASFPHPKSRGRSLSTFLPPNVILYTMYIYLLLRKAKYSSIC